MEEKEIIENKENEVVEEKEEIKAPEITDDKGAYEKIIANQNSQIEALMNYTESLTKQINNMIAGGVQINDSHETESTMQPESSQAQVDEKPKNDDEYTMEGLGRLIGRKN